MLNRWQRTIVDLRGNVVPYAQLQILREQTQSAPTIYRDKAGTEAIPNAIVTANQNGYAYFYAPADLYRIRSTQPTIDWRDVDLGSAAAQQLAQQALDNAVPTYETLVDMQADTGQPVPTLGRVVNDSTLEDNGYYVWTGTTWERAAYQYLSGMDVSIEPAPSKIPRATGAGVIREAWVEDLPFNYDQIYAQLWLARYPGIPAPSFYQEFGGGASLLDPRITYTRSTPATYIENGVVKTVGVDELAVESSGAVIEAGNTNYYALNDYQTTDLGWRFSDAGLTVTHGFTAPDGTNTAIHVEGVTDTRNFNKVDISGKGLEIFSVTYFIKPLSSHLIGLGVRDDENNAEGRLNFSPMDKSFNFVDALKPIKTDVTELLDGWLRIQITWDLGVESERVWVRNGSHEIGTPLNFLMWHGQIEKGYPSSFIYPGDTPTTRGIGTYKREADADFINPQQGAIILDVENARKSGEVEHGAYWEMHKNSEPENRIYLTYSRDGDKTQVQGHSITGFPEISASVPAQELRSVGFWWRGDEVRLYVNG